MDRSDYCRICFALRTYVTSAWYYLQAKTSLKEARYRNFATFLRNGLPAQGYRGRRGCREGVTFISVKDLDYKTETVDRITPYFMPTDRTIAYITHWAGQSNRVLEPPTVRPRFSRPLSGQPSRTDKLEGRLQGAQHVLCNRFTKPPYLIRLLAATSLHKHHQPTQVNIDSEPLFII